MLRLIYKVFGLNQVPKCKALHSFAGNLVGQELGIHVWCAYCTHSLYMYLPRTGFRPRQSNRTYMKRCYEIEESHGNLHFEKGKKSTVPCA
jgi:hypothetical protein